jgi:hypothetical protein
MSRRDLQFGISFVFLWDEMQSLVRKTYIHQDMQI